MSLVSPRAGRAPAVSLTSAESVRGLTDEAFNPRRHASSDPPNDDMWVPSGQWPKAQYGRPNAL